MSERKQASRSGGRTASQGDRDTKYARGARNFPTQGATALKLDSEPRRERTPAAPRLRVAPPAPINAPRAPFIALIVAVVMAGVIGILLINTKTAENAFKLDTLQQQQSDLDVREQALRNEIAANQMPGSLDAAAKRLGLVKAESPAFITLPDGKIIGVPAPPSGDPAVTAQRPETTGR